ncbi:MAG TPA: pantetheine-phosphate adenylyltransferase [Propionibacteriaceae bacterium]|nr:pantetheine-phosphate adenylyltransferase [Propionibacteriaceae bacterium]
MSTQPRTAVVPGSYDPITRGHLDIVRRARGLADRVIVAVGDNTTKNYLFTQEERVRLAQASVADLQGVSAEPLTGLLVDFAAERGATVIVKGLRFAGDFDYELQMAHLNSHLRPGIETVFLPAGRQFGTISSSLLRTIAHNGGDISEFVTPEVLEAVRARVSRPA